MPPRAMPQASGLKEPVVLLSPACASFDQYPNFEVRGKAFTDLVRAMPGVTSLSRDSISSSSPGRRKRRDPVIPIGRQCAANRDGRDKPGHDNGEAAFAGNDDCELMLRKP